MKVSLVFLLLLVCCSFSRGAQTGRVLDVNSKPIAGARVTLFNSDTSIFYEVRTDSNGFYSFGTVPGIPYTIGVSAVGLQYRTQILTSAGKVANFILAIDDALGKWDIKIKAGEKFGGTNLAVLLPDGRIMYCHDTKDPVIYDPVKNTIFKPDTSPSIQGCVAPCLLQDGKVIFVGGTDKEVYGPGTKQVKTYDPRFNKWQVLPNLIGERWYPTMVQLPEGQLLATGGGGLQNPKRVNTSELMNPLTGRWTSADTTAIGNEVSPTVLLQNGEVLMTHRPPQLYNQQSGKWRLAAPFVQSPRTPDGDHADHEITELPDGRVIAIGYKQSYFPNKPGHNVEIYDPALNVWKLGADFMPVRSRCKSTLLPNKKILVTAGFKETLADTTYANEYGYMKLVDEYDPYSDTWRRLGSMNLAREYHATPVLVPDGRVIIVGGEGRPGEEPKDTSLIEAFTPPYLLRGIRPQIVNFPLSQSFSRGSELTFGVEKTVAPTRIILMGTSAKTHFMDCGIARYVELPFSVVNGQVTVTLPLDTLRLPLGFYILFVMVDDVPSIGRIIHIAPASFNNVSESSGRIDRDFRVSKSGEMFTFNFLAPVSSHMKLMLYDVLGRPLEAIAEADVASGPQVVNWKPAHLHNFTCFVSLEIGGNQYFQEIQCFP